MITDRKEKNILKDQMLIISNYPFTDQEIAYKIFQIYLKRSKIKSVFKFFKEQLGWEAFQIKII